MKDKPLFKYVTTEDDTITFMNGDYRECFGVLYRPPWMSQGIYTTRFEVTGRWGFRTEEIDSQVISALYVELIIPTRHITANPEYYAFERRIHQGSYDLPFRQYNWFL